MYAGNYLRGLTHATKWEKPEGRPAVYTAPFQNAHPFSVFGLGHLYFCFQPAYIMQETQIQKKVSTVYRFSVPECALLLCFPVPDYAMDTHFSHIPWSTYFSVPDFTMFCFHCGSDVQYMKCGFCLFTISRSRFSKMVIPLLDIIYLCCKIDDIE